MDIKKEIKKIKNRKDVLAVYLFGSQATGNVHKKSDIDICIIPYNNSEEEREDIGLVIDISKDYPDYFDFVNFYRLPIQIRYRIFKEGKKFFSRNDKMLHLIKFNTLKEYFDMKPMLDRFYENILSRGRKDG